MDTIGLGKNSANFVPLSPISFLRNAARIYPSHTAVIYDKQRYSWSEFYQRCGRMAAALTKRGIHTGDVVSFVAANTPELLEAHFSVPMAGAVLNAINTRLDTNIIRYILMHAETKIVFVDSEFADKVAAATAEMDKPPLIVDIISLADAPRIGECDYEAFMESAGDEFLCHLPEDELQPIALNYTSGTTGNPKGVVYHHRGAYLMAMGSVVAWDMRKHQTHLCTVPMFHCNGWCYPWTQTLLAGISVCLRKVEGESILRLIDEHHIDSLGGAPIVLSTIAEAGQGKSLPRPVKVVVAGAPPPPSVLSAMEAIGFVVTHVYGLTETFGHTTICAWQDDWGALSATERAEKQAQQGVGYPILQDWAILDSNNAPVPMDGKTIGEIGLRGNTIMSGYLKNPQATQEAFAEGWFKTGDLAVWNESTYMRIADRLKDIIISGGENISSIAVENAITKHPAVLLAAVVAKPDDKWGEVPCAFVELRSGAEAPQASELIEFCRQHLPGFMCPKHVMFGELPKTATGKIKKYELRQQAKELASATE